MNSLILSYFPAWWLSGILSILVFVWMVEDKEATRFSPMGTVLILFCGLLGAFLLVVLTAFLFDAGVVSLKAQSRVDRWAMHPVYKWFGRLLMGVILLTFAAYLFGCTSSGRGSAPKGYDADWWPNNNPEAVQR